MGAITPILTAAAFLLTATMALAEVSSREANKLGGPTLTPVGAERAGNAEGTIPPWTGGITEPPPGFEPGDFHTDPYPDDPIRFTITAGNVERYGNTVSDGQKALLQAYPGSWRMNVYPTRRSAAYPDFIYQGIKFNATHAQLETADRGGVQNSILSSPFPIPTQGVEVVWNHNLRWRGVYVRRINGQAAVTRALANYRVVLFLEEVGFPYGTPSATEFKNKYPNVALAFRQKVLAPSLLSGSGQLVIESANPTRLTRNTWVYSPNLRRVFRTPFDGFDNPGPFSDGLRFNDELDMFNGSPELFDWKILGKRELFIPYNAYRLHSGDLSYSDILRERHIDPELARYELHRVWVVEGTLKPDKRHLYSRRVFYLDEDSWQIAVTEAYDRNGALWRVAEGHIINYYEMPLVWTTLEVYHDLRQRRYLVNGLDNQRQTYEFRDKVNVRTFSPNALDYYVR